MANLNTQPLNGWKGRIREKNEENKMIINLCKEDIEHLKAAKEFILKSLQFCPDYDPIEIYTINHIIDKWKNLLEGKFRIKVNDKNREVK